MSQMTRPAGRASASLVAIGTAVAATACSLSPGASRPPVTCAAFGFSGSRKPSTFVGVPLPPAVSDAPVDADVEVGALRIIARDLPFIGRDRKQATAHSP